LITEKLQNLIANNIATSLINSAKVGLGGNSTFPTQADLDVPLASVSATSVVTNDANSNVVQIKVTVSGNQAGMTGQVLREIGLFNSSDLVIRQNFDGIGPFSSNDTLEFFILLEVE
tara:strand:- start:184 stop:534 length:351 start_codon:yes stop_codon:yes gene_type:complete